MHRGTENPLAGMETKVQEGSISRVTVSKLGQRDRYKLRSRQASFRTFVTAADRVRLGAAVVEQRYEDIIAATTLVNQRRLADIQESGLTPLQHQAASNIAYRFKTYLLFRIVNEYYADARLICSLLGRDFTTKDMGIKEKSLRGFGGGFVAKKDGSYASGGGGAMESKETATPKKPRQPLKSIGSRRGSMVRAERAPAERSLVLELPLAFINVLYIQERIKAPRIKKVAADHIYGSKKLGEAEWEGESSLEVPLIYVNSNDAKGSIKAGCIPTGESIEFVDVDPPPWYFHLYISRLPFPEEGNYATPEEFHSAVAEYHQQSRPEIIKMSWERILHDCPDWYKDLWRHDRDAAESISGKSGSTAEEAWNPGRLLSVKRCETYNGSEEYHDMKILAKEKNGELLPVLADLDFGALVPNRTMSDAEILDLQNEAEVLPEKREEILRDSPCGRIIDREMYFNELVKLDERYPDMLITGVGTRAEGDLICAYNNEVNRLAELEEKKKRRIQELGPSSHGKPTKIAEKPARTSISSLLRQALRRSKKDWPSTVARSHQRRRSCETRITSAHHGAETANPFPESLSENTKFFCMGPDGDYVITKGLNDLLRYFSGISTIPIGGAQYTIPVNHNWQIPPVKFAEFSLVDRIMAQDSRSLLGIVVGEGAPTPTSRRVARPRTVDTTTSVFLNLDEEGAPLQPTTPRSAHTGAPESPRRAYRNCTPVRGVLDGSANSSPLSETRESQSSDGKITVANRLVKLRKLKPVLRRMSVDPPSLPTPSGE